MTQAEGWPIGSGIVESGNKLEVEVHLKGSGMNWAELLVSPMLALRNIVCSSCCKVLDQGRDPLTITSLSAKGEIASILNNANINQRIGSHNDSTIGSPYPNNNIETD